MVLAQMVPMLNAACARTCQNVACVTFLAELAFDALLERERGEDLTTLHRHTER